MLLWTPLVAVRLSGWRGLVGELSLFLYRDLSLSLVDSLSLSGVLGSITPSIGDDRGHNVDCLC